MKKVLYIINRLGTSAISNVLSTITPYISANYRVSVLSIEPIDMDSLNVLKIKKNCIPIDSLNLNRYAFLKAYIKLKRYLNIKKPDIIHSNAGRADIISALCKPHNTKLINTFHCLRRGHTLLTQLGYLLADSRFDLHICISEAVKNSYFKYWMLKTSNIVVYNPVTLPEEPVKKKGIRKKIGICSDEHLLVSVARLVECKGHIDQINVMEELKKRNVKAKLVIVGDGPLKEKLLKNIHQRNVINDIIMLGYRSDAINIISEADLFLFTSRKEGLGIAVIEANLLGIPVIVSSLDAIREYIKDQKNGIIVNTQNTAAFADQIVYLLKHPKIRDKLAKKAILKAKCMFAPEKISKQYRDIYQKVLSE